MSNTDAQPVSPDTTSLDYPDRGGIGRPTTYTPAVAQLIATRLADGELLSEICRTPGLPTRQTVHQWRMRIPAFNDLYMRAREIGMESMGDDTLLIADDDSGDILPDGTPNSANVQRSRLQVDTRKFLMAKLAPKVYGDRVEVEHSGNVTHRVTMSDRERMRRLATFLAEDQARGLTIEGQAQAIPPPCQPTDDDVAAEPLDEPRAMDDEI